MNFREKNYQSPGKLKEHSEQKLKSGNLKTSLLEFEHSNEDLENLLNSSPLALKPAYAHMLGREDIIDAVEKSMEVPNLSTGKHHSTNSQNYLISTSNLGGQEVSDTNIFLIDQMTKNLTQLPTYLDNNNTSSKINSSRDNYYRNSQDFTQEDSTSDPGPQPQAEATVDLTLIKLYYHMNMESQLGTTLQIQDFDALCESILNAKDTKQKVGALMQTYSYIFSAIYFSASKLAYQDSQNAGNGQKFKLFNTKLNVSTHGLEFMTHFIIENIDQLLTGADDLSCCVLLEILDCIGPFNLNEIFRKGFAFDHLLQNYRNQIVKKKCVKFLLHCGYMGLEL
jgi:hypothetical protein